MWLLFLCFSTLLHFVVSSSEQGYWTKTYLNTKQGGIHAFPRSFYNGTKVKVAVHCKNAELHIKWLLRRTPCSNEYEGLESDSKLQRFYLDYPNGQVSPDLTYQTVDFQFGELDYHCDEQHPNLVLDKIPKYVTAKVFKPNGTTPSQPVDKSNTTGNTPAKSTGSGKILKKRSDNAPTVVTPTKTKTKEVQLDYMTYSWKDGYYVFILLITNKEPYNATVSVEYDHSSYGRISAVEWPLLVFFGVMGLVYIILGLVWLVLLACNWRDLLRVQFWIGGVLVLGMLEAAVFFGEYENLSKTGSSVEGAVILGELVSALKRTLARMLVIIVSLGFGIVKPRLGQAFHKVLCVGAVFFILSSIEGCMRALKNKSSPRKDSLLAAVPLAVVDAVICWWIFSALVQTTRTLRLRRNIVKLSLYRHFTNTLIFAVLASIAFMIWSITQHKMQLCLTDWKELWVDEAFWHLLFLLILFIIMLLWRPSTNNQRYAFSPLLDAADDEDEEENVMHDAFEGMKMRGTKSQANGSPRQKDVQTKAEDDLKWVEENIPSSVTDKALPSLLDSDEEIMTTKFEMSKME